MTKILLDVMYEDLQLLLMDSGLTVETVSQRLGVTKQARDDGKVLQHAKENGMAVATADKKLIDRLKASNVCVVTVDVADKASPHRAKLIKALLMENKEIKIIYLPKGLPYLNAVEECWHRTKQASCLKTLQDKTGYVTQHI